MRPLDCFAALAMTGWRLAAEQPPGAREGSGQIKANLQAYSKLFQISACFLQTFPKKALVVLWYFNDLQGFQIKKSVSKFFRHSGLFWASFQTPSRRTPQYGAIQARARSTVRVALRSGLAEDAFIAEQRSGSREF
jgi:hypothetical protein